MSTGVWLTVNHNIFSLVRTFEEVVPGMCSITRPCVIAGGLLKLTYPDNVLKSGF